MNKKFLVVALALAMSSTVMAAAGSTAGYISKSLAKAIVLSDADVNASDAIFVKTALDIEDGKPEIDVEFFVPSIINGVPVYQEYDYNLNAVTGAILSKDTDIEEFNNHISDTDWDGVDDNFDSSNNIAGTEYISESTAKQIALAHARVTAADATFVKTELDRDDAEIEVEFFVATTINGLSTYKEYDYTLNAFTGDIISVDADIENFNDDKNWDDILDQALDKWEYALDDTLDDWENNWNDWEDAWGDALDDLESNWDNTWDTWEDNWDDSLDDTLDEWEDTWEDNLDDWEDIWDDWEDNWDDTLDSWEDSWDSLEDNWDDTLDSWEDAWDDLEDVWD